MKYKIRLNIIAQKLYTTDLGQQKSTALNLPFTISLDDERGNKIYIKKHQINQQQGTIDIVTNKLPTFAAIEGNYILPSAF